MRRLCKWRVNLGEFFMYQSYLAVCQFKFNSRIFNFGDEILRGQKENQKRTLVGPDVIWTQPFASGSRTRGARNLSAPLALRWKLFADNCGHTMQTVWHILIEFRKFSRLREAVWKEEQRKEPFGLVELNKMLTQPPYTKKAICKIRFPKQYRWERYRLLMYSKWRMTKALVINYLRISCNYLGAS